MSDNYVPKFDETHPIEENVPQFDETHPIEENSQTEQSPGLLSKFGSALKQSVADSPTLNPYEVSGHLVKNLYNTVKPSDLTAPLAGAQQSLSMGQSDELAGAINAGIDTATGTSPDTVPDEPALSKYKRLYKEYRDIERNRLAKLEKEHPTDYLAGDLATAAISPVASLNALKNVSKTKGLYDKFSKLSKAKQAAIGAGITGFAEGVGRSEGETPEEVLTDAAKTGALSTVLGGTIGKVSDNMSKANLAKKAEEKLKTANINALQAIGATPKDISEELGVKTSKRASANTAKGTGNVLLENDMISPMKTPSDTVDALNTKLDEVYTKELAPHAEAIDKKLITKQNDVINATDDFINNSLNTISDFQDAAKYTLKDGPALSEGAGTVMNNIINDLKNAPADKKLSTAIKARQSIRDMTNFNKSEIPQAQQFYKEVYGNLNKYIDDLSIQADPEAAKAFKEANKLYGRLSDAREISVNNLVNNMANTKPISTGDFGVPAIASMAITPVLGLPAGVATMGAFAAKKGIEHTAQKDLAQIWKAYAAKKAFKQANTLNNKVANYESTLSNTINKTTPEAIGGASAGVAGSINDENIIKQQVLRDYALKASPQQLQQNSEQLKSKYGKNADKLAAEINSMQNSDRQGKIGKAFSIQQDPNNRKMLEQMNNVDVEDENVE